jgi:hypothetical protein
VARQDFQATWIPRIGQEATDALRSYRRASILPLASCVLAGAAGLRVRWERDAALHLAFLSLGCAIICHRRLNKY